jgi:hypothetical protein
MDILELANDSREKHIGFYVLPDKLDYHQVDPLIRGVVKTINESGWVLTAESCAGHPEETGPVWANNTRPMIRLVTRKKHLGAMLGLLLHNAYASIHPDGWAVGGDWHPVFEILPVGEWRGELASVLVYVDAKTVYQRDLGIAVFARFAAALKAAHP